MPYSIDNPPAKIKDMPKHAQEIFIAAFNAAIVQYKGDESKAHAVAYAAVKTKYKQNDKGEWVSKEAEKPIETPIAKGVDVVEISCPDCHGERFEPEGSHLRCVQCGTLVETKQEANMTIISDIIQEAAKRGKVNDPKVQRLVVLTELTEADTAEANSVLAWLKLQEVMKTEDGVEYPASAFAYTPDAELSSTWKLRLWEDAAKKVTRSQLGRAAAALSPGGFRGQKVEIPSADLPAVKRKIRAEYRKLDIADEDIPRWVQESESRTLLSDYIPLTEAKIGTKGKALVTVIKPGFNASKERYYPAETLARDYKVFEGIKMYADHPTEKDEKERPERSIRDWVATLQNVHPGADGVIVGEAVVVEPWMQEKLATLRDNSMLKDMGISINAVGSASKAEIEGVKTNFIERIVRARSVDFVTEAGAGGGIQLYESGGNADLDIDLVGLDTLRDRRPDLVKSIESAIRTEISMEVKKKVELEDKVKDLETNIITLTTERDGLLVKITEADKAKAKAEAQAIIKEAIAKAELPDAAKVRLTEQFKEAEKADGVAEAIKAEGEYIAKLADTGKVKGLGGSQPNPEKDRAALKESFKRLGMSDKEADIAVAGR